MSSNAERLIEREAGSPLRVAVHSVNVGMPSFLGRELGAPVQSGFKKQPIGTKAVVIGMVNIEGDGQADLTVHGGPEKAIYAYSIDRYADWRVAAGIDPITPAYFGENLTVSGCLETDVRIGDVWAWGTARIQVCQPRWPCYKFALASGRPELSKIMLDNGWTGWYFRVLTAGSASMDDPVVVDERGPLEVSVYDAHAARMPGAPRALMERVAAAPALATKWRASLEKTLSRRTMRRPLRDEAEAVE